MFVHPVKLLMGELTSCPAPEGWVITAENEDKIPDAEELYFKTKKISEAKPNKCRKPGNQPQSRASHTPRLRRCCMSKTHKRQEIKEAG